MKLKLDEWLSTVILVLTVLAIVSVLFAVITVLLGIYHIGPATNWRYHG